MVSRISSINSRSADASQSEVPLNHFYTVGWCYHKKVFVYEHYLSRASSHESTFFPSWFVCTFARFVSLRLMLVYDTVYPLKSLWIWPEDAWNTNRSLQPLAFEDPLKQRSKNSRTGDAEEEWCDAKYGGGNPTPKFPHRPNVPFIFLCRGGGPCENLLANYH